MMSRMKKSQMKTIIENQSDLALCKKGRLDKSQVRKLIVNLTLDRQEPYLYLSKTLINLLGLKPVVPIADTDACSLSYCKLFGPVRIYASKQVLYVREVPDGFPPSMNADLFIDSKPAIPKEANKVTNLPKRFISDSDLQRKAA